MTRPRAARSSGIWCKRGRRAGTARYGHSSEGGAHTGNAAVGLTQSFVLGGDCVNGIRGEQRTGFVLRRASCEGRHPAHGHGTAASYKSPRSRRFLRWGETAESAGPFAHTPGSAYGKKARLSRGRRVRGALYPHGGSAAAPDAADTRDGSGARIPWQRAGPRGTSVGGNMPYHSRKTPPTRDCAPYACPSPVFHTARRQRRNLRFF